jgi:hypothetical protein
MCRCFIVLVLDGGVDGRLSVDVKTCLPESFASLAGWEDGSHPPLGSRGCRHSTLAFVASVPNLSSPSSVAECESASLFS